MKYYDIFDKDIKTISIVNRKFSSLRTSTNMDFSNYLVLPAFVDAHTHAISMTIRHNWLDLIDVDSKKALLSIIKEYMDNNMPYLIGYRFDESKWSDDKSYPTRKELDDVAPDMPVYLVRIDGHIAVANTKTIDVLGLKRDMFHDYHRGIIVEDNVHRVEKMFIRRYNIAPSEKAIEEFILRAIPAVCDMNMSDDPPKRFLDKISKTLEIHFYKTITNITDLGIEEIAKKLERYKARQCGLKLFVDGSIGARTAFLEQPYRDDPSNRGVLLMDQNLLEEIVSIANRLRIQLAIHAIGDAAIDIALNALKLGDPSLRHRIEHFELPHEDHIQKLSRYGVIPSMQPNFIANWQIRGGLYERRLGWDRAKSMNPLKTIFDSFGLISFGSDCMPLDPFYGIYGALIHPLEHERLSFEEAVICYTYGSAYSFFCENRLGKIDEGYDASFGVYNLPRDKLSPELIRSAKPLFMFIRGEKIHTSK